MSSVLNILFPVIAGCDRSGTTYGLLDISGQMGMSPLYWWEDVPVRKRSAVYVSAERYVSSNSAVETCPANIDRHGITKIK